MNKNKIIQAFSKKNMNKHIYSRQCCECWNESFNKIPQEDSNTTMYGLSIYCIHCGAVLSFKYNEKKIPERIGYDKARLAENAFLKGK